LIRKNEVLTSLALLLSCRAILFLSFSLLLIFWDHLFFLLLRASRRHLKPLVPLLLLLLLLLMLLLHIYKVPPVAVDLLVFQCLLFIMSPPLLPPSLLFNCCFDCFISL